ncbi:hypothetical protein [Planococcus sp. 107-1]|uniref:hypothetical protein n=1 Tax=Planococcus sp. 107-1 TaxID=2908840 RepID=UPI001F1D40EC|nr:hypothetical protein [Planococcus sp. 107-1]UJF26689.1 hypothetical protein L0M13_16365 [Planococcus sp. 107-1]
MPQTIWGKLSFAILILLAIEIAWAIIMVFVNFLGAMTVILQFTPFLAAVGMIVGVAGVLNEKKKAKRIPLLTLLLSFILIALFLTILFGFQFGG